MNYSIHQLLIITLQILGAFNEVLLKLLLLFTKLVLKILVIQKYVYSCCQLKLYLLKVMKDRINSKDHFKISLSNYFILS